jgi:hypothetical protein
VKRTFVALLLAAIGVWGYVVFRVVLILAGGGEGMGNPKPVAGAAAAMALLARPRPALDTSFRDPFQSYLYSQKPAPAVPKAARPAAPPKAIDPPKAVLTGILWGDEPVAILKQDGQTELVKQGATAWDLTVTKIEKNRVTVRKQGHTFTLEY